MRSLLLAVTLFLLPAPTISTTVLPVVNGSTRIVATTNVRGARLVWIRNGVESPARTIAGLRDTITFPLAMCPDTTVVQVAVYANNRGAATTRVLPCTPRAAPTARDSFPDAGRIIGVYAYQFRGAVGSSDSVLIVQPALARGVVQFTRVGLTSVLCRLGRNAFTGHVELLQDANVARCEPSRRAWDAVAPR